MKTKEELIREFKHYYKEHWSKNRWIEDEEEGYGNCVEDELYKKALFFLECLKDEDPLPIASAVEDGTVDFYWKKEECSLLINLSYEEEGYTYSWEHGYVEESSGTLYYGNEIHPIIKYCLEKLGDS